MKKVYFGLIKLFQTLVSLCLVMVYNHKGAASKLRRIKKDRQGKAVTILANGPSAKEIITTRTDLIEGTDLLVLNYFGNTEYFFKLKPTYYILLDPILFNYDFKNPGLNENTDEDARAIGMMLMNSFRDVDWKMTLFIPAIYDKNIFKALFDSNPNIEIVPFYGTRVLGYDSFQNYMYDRGQGVPSSRNVIIPAMLLMTLIGYKTIYLYGCEFSWTKTMDVDTDNGRLFFNDRHFNSKEEIRHFGKGAYLWWIEVIAEDLRATEHIAKFAAKKGVKIINRTKGSFIDAFEYENPDKIV